VLAPVRRDGYPVPSDRFFQDTRQLNPFGEKGTILPVEHDRVTRVADEKADQLAGVLDGCYVHRFPSKLERQFLFPDVQSGKQAAHARGRLPPGFGERRLSRPMRFEVPPETGRSWLRLAFQLACQSRSEV
jgi:hypothetical protein